MKNKVKKIAKITVSSLWWLLLVLLAVLLISVIGAKFRGEVPQVFGYSVLRIVSGSMEPEIPSGTYIVVKRINAEKVEKGDVISFYSEDPAIYGLPNTHRVEGIVREDGKLRFETKGDANVTADKISADSEKLIGVFVTKLEGLSNMSQLMSGKGFFAVIISVQVITVGLVAFSTIRKKDKDDDPKADDPKNDNPKADDPKNDDPIDDDPKDDDPIDDDPKDDDPIDDDPKNDDPIDE